jgi:hypothetical protein
MKIARTNKWSKLPPNLNNACINRQAGYNIHIFQAARTTTSITLTTKFCNKCWQSLDIKQKSAVTTAKLLEIGEDAITLSFSLK